MRARSQRAVFYVCSQSNHRCPPVNFLPTQWLAAYRVCQLVVLFSHAQMANLRLTCTGRNFLVILAKISRVLRDWSDRFAMKSYSLSFVCHHRKTTLQLKTHSKSFMIQDF